MNNQNDSQTQQYRYIWHKIDKYEFLISIKNTQKIKRSLPILALAFIFHVFK